MPEEELVLNIGVRVPLSIIETAINGDRTLLDDLITNTVNHLLIKVKEETLSEKDQSGQRCSFCLTLDDTSKLKGICEFCINHATLEDDGVYYIDPKQWSALQSIFAERGGEVIKQLLGL